MKSITLFPAVLLAAAVSGLPALAQDKVGPAPVPVAAAAIPADVQNIAEPAVIDHVVYLARLPSPAELMKGAEAQATPILRMDQTANRIVVVYQYAGGRTVTFAYTLLSSAPAANAPLAASTPTSTATYTMVSTPQPAQTVVYAQPQTVYYAPGNVRYYDPAWDFWAPLAIGVGLGWYGGFYGHGGYYGGHGGHYGGHGGHSGHGGWHH